jgi:hypothetical protein
VSRREPSAPSTPLILFLLWLKETMELTNGLPCCNSMINL